MANPAEAQPYRLPTPPSYSAAARKALAFSAVAVTLLPLPVTYFGILPAYQVHARFLLFYAPFLCLLTLSYLFYVRDSLARTMFADVLDPPPPPDPYYQEPISGRLGRWFRRLKGITLGILPVLLVITSMYCVSRYVDSFNQSVARAAEVYVERAGMGEEVGLVRAEQGGRAREEVELTREKRRGRGPAASSRGSRQPEPKDSAAADTLPQPADSMAVRQYLLRTSTIESIPAVVELTVLYIGAFVALLIAVTLMALKEYAKEAMGLSEHELMFGRYHQSDGQ
jgi:hypothetical protein